MKTSFDTRNSIPKKNRTKVTGILNQTLADLSDLYSQTKQAHWNITGPNFISLHKLFDELAATVEAHIDPLAERIVALGGVALGTVRQAAAASSIAEFPTDKREGLAYVLALADRYAKVGAAVRKGIDETDTLEDAGSSDLLTGISQDLDKALWFLEAHTR